MKIYTIKERVTIYIRNGVNVENITSIRVCVARKFRYCN